MSPKSLWTGCDWNLVSWHVESCGILQSACLFAQLSISKWAWVCLSTPLPPLLGWHVSSRCILLQFDFYYCAKHHVTNLGIKGFLFGCLVNCFMYECFCLFVCLLACLLACFLIGPNHSPWWKWSQGRNSTQELVQRPWRSAACCLAPMTCSACFLQHSEPLAQGYHH